MAVIMNEGKLGHLEKASVLAASDDPKDQDKAREIKTRFDYESLKKQIGSKKKPSRPAVKEAAGVPLTPQELEIQKKVSRLNVRLAKKRSQALQQAKTKDTEDSPTQPKDEVKEGSLHKWFKGSKSKDGKPGWVNVKTGGTCASDEPGEGTPKCVSSSKRASMTKAERDSASRRKKAADPGQQSKSGAAKPTYVRTDAKKKMNEDKILKKVAKELTKASKMHKGQADKLKKHAKTMTKEEAMDVKLETKKNCGCGQDPCITYGKKKLTQAQKVDEACWKGYEKKGMKTMFGKRYPNCVKKKATRKEEVQVEAKVDQGRSDYGKASIRNYRRSGPGHGEPAMFDPENKRGKLIDKRREEHKARRGVKGAKVPAYKTEEAQLTETDKKGKGSGTKDACYHKVKSRYSVWPSAYASGALVKCRKKGAANWGNSSKKEEFEYQTWKTDAILEKVAAWQRKEGKRESGGLNQKGVDSYRRENPGSKLKTAVTTKPSKLKKGSKAANRRKSFCARMGGMKKRLTSAKTARDPDSRINKALRKWNCSYEPQGTPIMEQDRALDFVRKSIEKKHGKGAIYDPKKDRPPTEAQKKKVAVERKKRQDADNKAYAVRAKKAGFKSTQDYTNVVARYGSEDNYRKGKGLGT